MQYVLWDRVAEMETPSLKPASEYAFLNQVASWHIKEK